MGGCGNASPVAQGTLKLCSRVESRHDSRTTSAECERRERQRRPLPAPAHLHASVHLHCKQQQQSLAPPAASLSCRASLSLVASSPASASHVCILRVCPSCQLTGRHSFPSLPGSLLPSCRIRPSSIRFQLPFSVSPYRPRLLGRRPSCSSARRVPTLDTPYLLRDCRYHLGVSSLPVRNWWWLCLLSARGHTRVWMLPRQTHHNRSPAPAA